MNAESFTVRFPDLHTYWVLEVLDRLLTVAPTILMTITSLLVLSETIDRGFLFAAFAAGATSFIAAILVATRKKRLRGVVNDRFAAEFTVRTGRPYPRHLPVLDVQRTVPTRNADGSILLWGIKRRRDEFLVTAR